MVAKMMGFTEPHMTIPPFKKWKLVHPVEPIILPLKHKRVPKISFCLFIYQLTLNMFLIYLLKIVQNQFEKIQNRLKASSINLFPMRKLHQILLALLLIVCLSTACSEGGNGFNRYQDEPIQVLNREQTIRKLQELEVRQNENGKEDIIITAEDGTTARFISYDACAGEGSSYHVIASIPRLGIVFLDRTDGCHMGETILMISLKDGTQRELQSFDIYDEDQFHLSPEKSWLVLSSCDCSIMGYSCNMEILSLADSESSLLKSVYFNEGFVPVMEFLGLVRMNLRQPTLLVKMRILDANTQT